MSLSIKFILIFNLSFIFVISSRNSQLKLSKERFNRLIACLEKQKNVPKNVVSELKDITNKLVLPLSKKVTNFLIKNKNIFEPCFQTMVNIDNEKNKENIMNNYKYFEQNMKDKKEDL